MTSLAEALALPQLFGAIPLTMTSAQQPQMVLRIALRVTIGTVLPCSSSINAKLYQGSLWASAVFVHSLYLLWVQKRSFGYKLALLVMLGTSVIGCCNDADN